MMQCPMKQIVIWNDYAYQIFAFSDLGPPRVLSISERLDPKYMDPIQIIFNWIEHYNDDILRAIITLVLDSFIMI